MPIRSRAELNLVNPPGQVKTLGDYVEKVMVEEKGLSNKVEWPFPTGSVTKKQTFLEWWWDPNTNIENLSPKELAEKAWFAGKANS
jgi:hypothetical protein